MKLGRVTLWKYIFEIYYYNATWPPRFVSVYTSPAHHNLNVRTSTVQDESDDGAKRMNHHSIRFRSLQRILYTHWQVVKKFKVANLNESCKVKKLEKNKKCRMIKTLSLVSHSSSSSKPRNRNHHQYLGVSSWSSPTLHSLLENSRKKPSNLSCMVLLDCQCDERGAIATQPL